MNRLINLIEKRLQSKNTKPVFSNYEKNDLNIENIQKKIVWIHRLFKETGIEQGDKIALAGRNTGEWAVVYIATLCYGAVIVPILPDFSATDVQHILGHSDSKLCFASKDLLKKVQPEQNFCPVISLPEFKAETKTLNSAAKKATTYLTACKSYYDDIIFVHSDEEKLAVISYTSGTSGFSKGVMLNYKSLFSNAKFAIDNLDISDNPVILSFLPLAHVFGCMFEFLWPFCDGAHIHFIEKIPAPPLLIKAFKEIKPKIIFMVPLLLEKIYKKKLLPVLNTPKVKFMLKIPVLKSVIYKKIKKSLVDTFGGNFFSVVVGGAALNAEVEEFLRKIKFPFSVGYGMTECGPLISYSHFYEFRPFSCGKIIDRMEVNIDSEDPLNIAGEILVRGDNVMLGYYKNEELTKKDIDEDGWLHTGDLGIVDKDDVIYIRGRSKNMLLGPSGQNIYPEEIEAKIANLDYVSECVVVDDKNNKLIALVYPDEDRCNAEKISFEKVANILMQNRKEFNKTLPAYMQIFKFVTVDKEFEKTPKKSIKRYLYANHVK